jgi:homoserine acetyltransferase
MPDYEIFELGDLVLQSGITLRQAKLAYKSYGRLAPLRDNVVVMPTFMGGQHTDTEPMMDRGCALDPARYFIIVPNMFGNGLSSSPSNTPQPLDRAAFPVVSLYDNVTCQHRLFTHLGIDRIKLVVGYSMGALQAYQWGALYSDIIAAIAPICGSARLETSLQRWEPYGHGQSCCRAKPTSIFRVRDNQLEVEQMPNAELRAIPSIWGHIAGFGGNPADNQFIDAALNELLE